MTRSTFGAAAACAAALFLSGCSKAPPPVVPAATVVRLNGQPLPHALVELIPTTAGFGFDSVATGTTDEKGRCQLTCRGQPGACAGEHRVTVRNAPYPDAVRGNQAEEAKFNAGLKNRPIPEKYGVAAQTPVTVTVTADQPEYTVELKR